MPQTPRIMLEPSMNKQIRDHRCCHYSTDAAGKIIAGQGSVIDGRWSIPCSSCAKQAEAWFAQETVLRHKPRQV
jgi:hypothetical protein